MLSISLQYDSNELCIEHVQCRCVFLHFGRFLLLLVAMGKSLDIENARLLIFSNFIETTRHDKTTRQQTKDDVVKQATRKRSQYRY